MFRSADRLSTRTALKARWVTTAIHYPLAITQQPAYKDLEHAPCDTSEAWAGECITVPCFPEMTDAEVDQVCDALAAVSG